MTANNEATVIATWLKLIVDVFDDAGHDATNLCLDVGINYDDLSDDNKRFDITQTFKLWDEIAKRSKNKLIAFRAGSLFTIEHLGSVGYSIMASESIKEAVDRAHRYHNILCDGINFETQEVEEGYRFYCKTAKGIDNLGLHMATDAVMAGAMATIRWISCEKAKPIKVVLNHPAYADLEEYEADLGCPVECDAEHSYVLYKKEDIEACLPTSNKMIVDLYDQINVKALQQICRDRPNKQLSHKVRDILIEKLPNGEPAIDSIAKIFNMSLRTFQRRLKDDGWTFIKLLDDTRKILAVHHLCENKFTLQETTFLLGFSDASIFNRAFKRWYGRTPAKYVSEIGTHLAHAS